MNAKRLLIKLGLGVAIVVGLISLIAWWPKGTGAAATASDTWTCSMHPQIRLPNPGRCPICGMQLIPVSQLPKARGDLETRAGLVTEPIQRRELFKELRTVGKLDYSERQVAYLSSRVNGRVDRLFVDFTGVEVKKGDHLVEIYSPELLIAQRELLIGLEAHEREKKRPASEGRNSLFAESTLESTRTKLRLLGILDEQIAEIEETRKPTTHLTIFAPIGGTVIEKNVRLGQYLNTGDQVYRIADLDPIWLYLNIYEFDVAWVRFGQTVDVQLEAFPGETFAGSIMFIDPFLDDATRTIRVRVNIKNPDRLLKPQMFATATIHVRLHPDGTPVPTGLEGKFVCPMHPEVIQDEPGKCSICAMHLEKVPERVVRGVRRGPSDGHTAHAGHSNKADDQKDTELSPLKPAQSDEPAEHKDHAAHTGHAKNAPAEKEPAEKSTTAGDGVLAIPVSAVLDTGRRRIAYRLTAEGAYELVDLKLGPRAHATDESGKRREFFVVLDGISEGDQVVSQSGFLLDSQRQIEGMPSLLYPDGQAGTSLHSGHGGMDMGGKGGAAPKTSSEPTTPGGHQH
jgi:RND family efflux transporter MFP subunit